ncbi:MAG: Gfo/Idh/MocA family protein [Candidatus Sericytochromatia bacterium]
MLKFGIIGCGRIAARHASHIAKRGQLQAVCDIVPAAAETLAATYGARPYVSIDEMLAAERALDLVAICSPNGLHAEHSIKVFRAGHHVLCEKPMAIRVQDCGEMIKAAENANKRLMIVKQNRFNPPVAALKQALDQGRLGKLSSVQLNCFWNRNAEYYTQSGWKGTRALDGGTLYTQFSHFIDLLYWLIGDVVEVEAYIGNFQHQQLIEFEDAGTAILKFYNGVIGTLNYTVNACKKNMEGSLTVFGDKGVVKIGGQYLNELEYQMIEDYSIEDPAAGHPPNLYGEYVGSMSNHDRIYDNVVEVLSNQGIISTNGFEGLKTVEIIEKIYRAASRHRQDGL